MLKINDDSSRLSTSHVMRPKFQIQRHDKQLHEDKPLENNGTIKPFLKGLFVHTVIIVVIVLGNLMSNIGNPKSMIETSLISSNELAGVQRQIAKSRRQAKKAGKTNPTSTTNMIDVGKSNITRTNNIAQKTTPQVINNQSETEETGIKKLAQTLTEIFASKDTPNESKILTTEQENIPTREKPTPSKEEVARQQKIAERKTELKKALEEFIKDEEARKARNKMEERRIIDEKELMEAFRESEKNIDNVVQKKKQTQKEIEQQREEDLATQQLSEQILTEQQGEGDESGFEAVKTMSLGVPSEESEASASSGKANTLQAVANKIQGYLHPPFGSGKDTSEAKITVNKKGEVIRVFIEGKNKDLNRAVEQAVNSASPLPIGADDKHYPIFSITFKGEGKE